MNAIIDTFRRSAVSGALTQAYYTLGAVPAASNIAVELGWLQEEFRLVGADPIYLRSLASNAGWLPHFAHSLDNLFRDGGAIPALHARADLTDTTLIGLTWVRTGSGGQILVRAGSGIRRVGELKGRRIGLYRSLNGGKVDFRRAAAERGILLALQLAGLSRQDVEIVDFHDGDAPIFPPAGKPSEYFLHGRERRRIADPESAALRAGKIDAIHAGGGRAAALANSGAFTVIEDLSRHPDWTLQVENGPFTSTVSTAFARKHPEVVVAFLRATIRAGRLIDENPALAVQYFRRLTGHPDTRALRAIVDDTSFVPALCASNLAALEQQKQFLLDHGYIKSDFDVRTWADDRYLQEALRSL